MNYIKPTTYTFYDTGGQLCFRGDTDRSDVWNYHEQSIISKLISNVELKKFEISSFDTIKVVVKNDLDGRISMLKPESVNSKPSDKNKRFKRKPTNISILQKILTQGNKAEFEFLIDKTTIRDLTNGFITGLDVFLDLCDGDILLIVQSSDADKEKGILWNRLTLGGKIK